MMKAFVAVVAGVVVYGITAFVLVEVLHAFWDMETAAVPVFIVNWVASIIGLILAREAAEKIAPPDRRRHAITCNRSWIAVNHSCSITAWFNAHMGYARWITGVCR